MALMNVNPTRMELTRLKKRLKTAVRGHKLLKDKRDEMMRRFVQLIRENAKLREAVEKELSRALGEFALCRGFMEPEMLEQAVMYPARTVSLEVGKAQHHVCGRAEDRGAGRRAGAAPMVWRRPPPNWTAQSRGWRKSCPK